jgi:Protein of unknown function (DUF3048) N-terminal domain/Protein of unknown function (DUF3048) C-terminal domain
MRELWSRWWRGCVAFFAGHPQAVAAGGCGLVAIAAGAIATMLVLASSPGPTGPGGQGGPAAGVLPTAAPGGLLSPFTGERVARLGPVVAVKIDNIVNARPQTGLGSADIVYVLPVEGGLSRFLAVFSSGLPPIIGPVRSAREDDLEVLRQFGTPAFAYSGATPQLLPVVERSRIVDEYSGRPAFGSAYFRDSSRVEPYNLYAHSAALLAGARRASVAGDIGFRFGPVPPSASGTAVTSYSARYSAASFTFRWSPRAGRWLIWMDGTPAMSTSGTPGGAANPFGTLSQLGAPTIIIQHTTIRKSRFLEYGKPPPYTQSVGRGSGLVLRGGQAYPVRWSRPSADSGTAYTLPNGQPMTFAPGQAWVLLVQLTAGEQDR